MSLIKKFIFKNFFINFSNYNLFYIITKQYFYHNITFELNGLRYINYFNKIVNEIKFKKAFQNYSLYDLILLKFLLKDKK